MRVFDLIVFGNPGATMSRMIIFSNGLLPDPQAAQALLLDDDVLIAADGGTRHALSLGLIPHAVIGDLDSIPEQDLVKLETSGVELIRHPADKNQTDLELAIEYALQRKPTEIIILAALGNRLDQTIGNISLLHDPRLGSIRMSLDDGIENVLLCRDRVQVNGRRGDLVSLIPWNGDAAGVTTRNLRWELENETLFQAKTRGISNEMLGGTAVVSIRSGSLLVIHRRRME